MKTIDKDPSAVLDYAFDWSDWLIAPDTIASYLITVSPTDAVTIDGDLESGGKVTVLVSGGTLNATARVDCKITTAQGLIDSRTIRLNMVDR